MLPTLALVVLISAIIVSFSEEIGKFCKKIYNIRGVKLFLPIIVASMLVVNYEPWVLGRLIGIKTALHALISVIANLFPFQTSAESLAEILTLMALTFAPVIALNEWRRYKKYEVWPYSWFISLIIWLITVILLTVDFNY